MMASSFDQGLLALHVDGAGDHMRGGGGGVLGARVLADATAPWPPQPVSLCMYNAAGYGGPSSSSSLVGHQQLAAAFAAPPAAAMGMQQPFHQLRSSKYLGPVKELLVEFCSLQGDLPHAMDGTKRAPKMGKWDDVDGSSSSTCPWGILSLSSMDLLDLERRKARLLSMVEEVDRRYRRYREQMRAAEASFEAVAGGGAAQVYTKLALRAMSRHFRCLRDALAAQVRALRKATGEKTTRDGGVAAAPGATKGDTPRLRVLDQCLRRQQRAFQLSGAVDSFPWRPQRGLPETAVSVLRAWLFEHFLHPYPNDVDKHILARQTGLSRSQVSNWFINARVRLWKPMIEDMYKEETEPESADHGKKNPSGSTVTAHAAGSGASKHLAQPHDHKITLNTTSSSTRAIAALGQISRQQLRGGNPNNSSSLIPPDDDVGGHQRVPFLHRYNNDSGGAVSLTLGLQQQRQRRPFASAAMMQQQTLMLDVATEEEEEAVLPYCRNLMGSQLLHDFAG
ncbi:hypothetical protein ABZP36_011767 [Zizania latifolia]